MKRTFARKVPGLALLLFLPSLPHAAAQFVEVTTELQICDWDYMFFYDRNHKDAPEPEVPSIFTGKRTRRCVFGAETWMIESVLDTFTERRWFTGTNIIAHTAVTGQTPDEVRRRISERTKLAMGSAPVGHNYTRIHESNDGNPGRPGGVADLMGFDLPASITWLAFCSAPTLKHNGRRLFPPSALWKESSIAFSGWSDSTERFKDDLGLPRNIKLISTNGQSIFHYQVRQSTNVLGWTIPLEFYGVQYLPTSTNGWQLHLTFKGRVIDIAPTSKPEIPPEVMKVVSSQ